MRPCLFIGVLCCFFAIHSCQSESASDDLRNLPSTLVEANGGKFYGDTLKVNSTEAITSLFPAGVSDIYSQHISSQIYEGLLKFNPKDLSLEPCIAESFEIDSATNIYTFKLRKNIYFHNNDCFSGGKGRQVNANDAKFVFEFLCSKHELNTANILWRNYILGADNYYQGKIDHVEGIKVIDDFTLKIELNEPFSGFLNMMALIQTSIFPKEALDYYGTKLKTEVAVGTGPFSLKNSGNSILLEKNNKYHKKDEFGNQLPLLSHVSVQFNNNKANELADFKSGKIDFIWGLPVEEIQNVIGSLKEAKEGKNKEFNLQSINNLQVEYYAFSFRDSLLQNIHLRKALNYAIDKAYIASYVLEGSVLPAKNGLIPEVNGYDKTKVSGYDFNPTKARVELQLSGYKPKKNDRKLIFHYNNSGQINQPIAIEIQRQIKANLGIDLVLKESDRKTFFEKLDTGQLPFWRYGWIADYPDPADFMTAFHSKNIKGSTNNSNKSYFSNPKFDQYFDRAMAESSLKERMKLLAKAEQVLLDEAALIPLFHFTSIRLVNPKLKDFPINELEYRDYSIAYFSAKKKKNIRIYENIEVE
ncbi:MAG: ABC transporter substrate-binding protein [Crocinitomicaceae bacterium]